MKIKATTTFLDGTNRFEKGMEYIVSDLKGVTFIAHGWAKDANSDSSEEATSLLEDVTLDVHSVMSDSSDNLPGVE